MTRSEWDQLRVMRIGHLDEEIALLVAFKERAQSERKEWMTDVAFVPLSGARPPVEPDPETPA